MPKIKVKNILSSTKDKICNTHPCYSTCPLHTTVQLDNGDVVFCVKDVRYEPKERVVELTKQEFPTNREWIESLSNEDLAAFYTHGVLVERYSPFPVNLHQIVGNFVSSEQGIKNWLSEPCKFLMEVDTDANNL